MTVLKIFTSFLHVQQALYEHHLREGSFALSANTELAVEWMTPEVQTGALSVASEWQLPWPGYRGQGRSSSIHCNSKEQGGRSRLTGPVASHLEEF